MVLNNRGQAMGFFFLLMVGIVMFILGFALASPLVKSSAQAMTNLDCNNSSISTDQKVTCGVVDIIAPWVIGIIFGMGGLVLGSKLIGVG